MSLRVVIELAGPPRGKGAGRAAIGGDGHARVFTDERTRKYESQLRFTAQQQMAGRPPTAQPLQVEIEVRLPIPTTWSRRKVAAALAGQIWPIVRPDLENFAKAMDGLNGVVWVDDKQIVDERIRKIYSDRPGLTITVATMEPPAVVMSALKQTVATNADLFAGAA